MIDEVPTLRDWLALEDKEEPLPKEFKTSTRVSPAKIEQVRRLAMTRPIKQVALDVGLKYITVYNIVKGRTYVNQ